MRILIATSNRAIVGGIEKYLQALIPALSTRGHDVAVLYEHRSTDGAATVDPPDLGLPLFYWKDLDTPTLPQEAVAWEPDVVYTHGLASLGVEEVLLDKYPVVWYAHVYLGTCASGRKCHSFPQTRPCSRQFGPACLLLYYPRRCGGLNPITAWRMFHSHARRYARLKDYRTILVASTHMYREYEQHGVSPNRLELVPLPITDGGREALMPVRRAPGGRILFIGRLTDLKGVHYLIPAIARAEKDLGLRLTLTVAGDGPELTNLKTLAAKLGVKAEFPGWVETKQKIEFMRSADLLAVPSLWPEPFGLVGIEAGGLGLPAVGYAVGGIPDWLVPGCSGELAAGDPPTVQGLAEAIVRACADPAHYAALCRGAWERARRFTLDVHVTKLEEILNAAVDAFGRPDPVAWSS